MMALHLADGIAALCTVHCKCSNFLIIKTFTLAHSSTLTSLQHTVLVLYIFFKDHLKSNPQNTKAYQCEEHKARQHSMAVIGTCSISNFISYILHSFVLQWVMRLLLLLNSKLLQMVCQQNSSSVFLLQIIQGSTL